MAKRFIFAAIMLVMTAIIATSLSELLIELIFPVDFESLHSKFEARQRYKYRLRPNLRLKVKYAGRLLSLQTNDNGLRESQNIPYQAASGELRVLCLGDSFTQGLGLNEDETYVRVTENILKKSIGPCVRAINMGVGGFGPSLEYLYWMEEGTKYSPHVVLIQVYLANDVSDDARDKRFELRDGNLVERPLKLSKLKLLTDFPLYQWLLDRSHLLQRIRLFSLPLLYGSELRNEEGPIVSEVTFQRVSKLTEAVWRHMVSDIRRVGGTPVFLSIGGPELFPDRLRLAERVPWKQRSPHFLQRCTQVSQQTHTILENLCVQMEVPCIDAATALRVDIPDIATAFIDGDNHLSPAGARVVGCSVAKTVETLLRNAPDFRGSHRPSCN